MHGQCASPSYPIRTYESSRLSCTIFAPTERSVWLFVHTGELDALTCPLTLEPLVDPVITADGQTYECAAIKAWFACGKKTSPLTGAVLPHLEVIPNTALKKAIAELRNC